MDARTRRMLVLREFATKPETPTALKEARGQVIAHLTSRSGNGEPRLTDIVIKPEADDATDS